MMASRLLRLLRKLLRSNSYSQTRTTNQIERGRAIALFICLYRIISRHNFRVYLLPENISVAFAVQIIEHAANGIDFVAVRIEDEYPAFAPDVLSLI